MVQFAPLWAIFISCLTYSCIASSTWTQDVAHGIATEECEDDSALSLVQKRQTTKSHNTVGVLEEPETEEKEEAGETKEEATSEATPEEEDKVETTNASESNKTVVKNISIPLGPTTTTLEWNTTTTPDFFSRQIPVGVDPNFTKTTPPPSTRPPTTTLYYVAESWDVAWAKKVHLKAVLAESIVMMFFVMIGCGASMTVSKTPGSAWVLQVALSFGLAVTCLSYSIEHWKTGHLNMVVTMSLIFLGQMGWEQGLLMIVAQLVGSCCGALILCKMIPVEKDKSYGLGHNVVEPGYKLGQVLVIEAAMTFILMFVTLQAVLNPEAMKESILAKLAVGMAVFAGNSVLIPIDGCSMNPSRAFGPAYIAKHVRGQSDAFKGWWVFWFGPIMGGLMGAGCFRLFADDLWWQLYR